MKCIFNEYKKPQHFHLTSVKADHSRTYDNKGCFLKNIESKQWN